MQNSIKTLIAFVVLMILATLLYFAYLQPSSQVSPQLSIDKALQNAVDECDTIANKAADHLPEQLPFQRLEKAGRQARVLENCMHDHGYIENPLWVAQANVNAKRNAIQAHISVNEAYETLRRKAMLQVHKNSVLYWKHQP